jgi:hypothetical protein
MYDILESQVDEELRGRRELLKELNLDVSTGELLSAERAFTYADLHATLESKKTVVWITPHVALVRESGSWTWMNHCEQLEMSCGFLFDADGKGMVALARSNEHLLEICDVVLRLLAASVAHLAILCQRSSRDGESINATSLEYLMEQCQSLKDLSLVHLDMHENHCRVLGTYSRPGLKIELSYCRIAGAASEALAEVLGRNQGPTKLDHCETDNSVLANGLRGNSRLKSLTLTGDVDRRQVLAIAGALKENKGLVCLNIWLRGEEPRDAVCDSLKTHPTLEVLHLRSYLALEGVPLDPAAITSRIQALLDMMKMNKSIHTIHLNPLFSDHELIRGSVIPYHETNRLRPRLLATQKTHPIAYRAKLLGRALLAVRSDPSRFWMLVSGNAEVAFASTTAMTRTVTASWTASATGASASV